MALTSAESNGQASVTAFKSLSSKLDVAKNALDSASLERCRSCNALLQLTLAFSASRLSGGATCISEPRVTPAAASELSIATVRQQLAALRASAESYAADFVDVLLKASQQLGASDVHLRPTSDGLEVSARIDGVLQPWGIFPPGQVSDVVTRLKVLADLLTYRTDVPQEGRVRNPPLEAEIRVSSFPTLHGEKVVVRLFAAESRYHYLEDLGLPSDIHEHLPRLLDETSGALLITGPAGSGKTTTAYACLREIVRRSSGGRSIATLEDPVEVSIDGVAQSQVNPSAGFDLATGLRSLLRQDPEVILVGEMRDPATAGVALQASLTGQLVLTTFHAGSAASAVSRLLDMGLEPYILRSGIHAVLCQRLVRKLCSCAYRKQ